MINKLIQSAKKALYQKGFTELTIRMGYCQYWNHFAAYLFGAETLDINSLSEFSVHYYGTDIMKEEFLPSKKLMRAKHAFYVLLTFHETGTISSCPMACKKIRQPLDTESQTILDSYLDLRRVQNASDTTLDNLKRTLHAFLLDVPLNKISKDTLIKYLSQLGAQISKSSMKSKAGIIKRFLVYCRNMGHMEEDFSMFFPVYRNCSSLGIPSAYTPEELSFLLDYLKTSRKRNGKRDYVMALLMIIYGFRAQDIVRLKLSDIGWESSLIHFTQSKTHNYLEISLTPYVGNALAEYILDSRPQSTQTNVFLKADGAAIGCSSTVSTAISRAFLDSGIRIDGRRHGSHSLRHSLASCLLNQGTGVFEISRILGHSSVDSTRIYAKIDLKNLRLCELEVPAYE